MLFLAGASGGTAFALPSKGIDDVTMTQQDGTCTGVIKDTTGETVIGASVVRKGTTNGTINDFDGKVSLSGANKGDVIQISFVGYVTQEVVWDGKPLNVIGTTNGTINDFDGKVSLSGANKGDVIQISFVGYVTQEVVWDGKPLNVILKDDTQTLEEVVVVGFGTQKKVNLTGAVSTVGAKELASRPVTANP